jgi:cysteinyl-tRNA synthetase
MVTVDGQKMGKSLNNFVTLKQAFSGAHERLTRNYEPLAVRQLILNSHYRSPLDFSDAALFAAQSGHEKITRAVIELRRKESTAPEGEVDKEIEKRLSELKRKFEAAMNDDLNTSVALSVIFELVRLANGLLEEKGVTKKTLDAVDGMFRKLGGGGLYARQGDGYFDRAAKRGSREEGFFGGRCYS